MLEACKSHLGKLTGYLTSKKILVEMESLILIVYAAHRILQQSLY